jgi:diguanylate cyclase (GGDEF)-like protein
MENGHVTKLIGAIQDITQHKRDAMRINDLAFKDELTELPNRRLLIDRLEMAISASQRNGQLCALVAIDIDNFKLLNDSHGHFKGDLLLKAVAHELAEAVRESDTVARVGADEFMVVLTNLGTKPEEAAAQAKALAEQLCAKLRRSYQLGRIQHYSTVSIGAVAFGWNDEIPEEPMKRADLALTQAKASGCALTVCFEPEMQVAIERRVALEAAIRRGLRNQEFTLHYQAQVVERGDGDRRVVGAETLIRWHHPEHGTISPAEFIPVAEDSGLILDIGNYVLKAACEQLARWATNPNLDHMTLAVNVSARQFHQPGFVESVLQALAASGAPAQRLKLELTEGMLVTNIEEVVVKMKTLKTLGVSFSLDDFGTGYSSLSYLKRLPLDQLKIDQSFVRDILGDANDAAIARTVIGLADSMGLAIIAEGVETQEQRQFLAGEGCIAYQGYLFSRPVSIEDFEALAISERNASAFQPLTA